MIRKTEPNDILELANTMRVEDQREVQSMAGLSPLEALSLGYMQSTDCITGVGKQGTVSLVAGVVSTGSYGAVWMLSAPDIKTNARELATTGRAWITAMTMKHGRLENVVDARNKLHIRLIKFMGFDLGDPISNYGVDKIRVIPFKR